MKLSIYTIHDVKAQNYGKPFYAFNDDVARRSFEQEVNNPESTLNRAPEDYTLFCIGSFDDSTGLIDEQVPHSLGSALEYYQQPKPVQMPEYDGVN